MICRTHSLPVVSVMVSLETYPSFCYWWENYHRFPGFLFSLKWRNNERDGVSNHQPPDCLLNRLFRRRSKKTSKLRVTAWPLWRNSLATGEFPAQRARNAENVSIWWRHHVMSRVQQTGLYGLGHLLHAIAKFICSLVHLFLCAYRRYYRSNPLDISDIVV